MRTIYDDVKDIITELITTGDKRLVKFVDYAKFSEFSSFGELIQINNYIEDSYKVVIGNMPDKQNGITIVPQRGFDKQSGNAGTRMPGLQLIINHLSYASGLYACEYLEEQLTENGYQYFKTIVSDTKIYAFDIDGSTIPLGKDDAGRNNFSMNFIIKANV